MRKAKKKASKTMLVFPSRIPPTSDTTVFLEKEADRDSESETEYVSPNEDAKPPPLSRKFSSRKLDCVVHRRCEKPPEERTIRTIEKEIDRHTAEVKQQKAIKHLTTPGSPSSNSKLDSESTSPYIPTELLNKASSVDMGIKQLLIKPSRKPSLSKVLHVPTKKKLARKLQKEAQSTESLLKINPFKINQDLDLLELREMLNQGERSNTMSAMPRITDEKARRQYQVFNDRRLLAPIFNFCKTAHMDEGKKKVTNVDLENGKPQQLFHFRDVQQLLTVTRKNRRMYRENKWDVVRRVRDTNQCNISLAIKRRMIDYLNSSVQTFSKEITAVEEETEQFARAFDGFLRENDEQSIRSIHQTREATAHRQEAADRCRAIEVRNNLLINHNIRSQEKIRLLDRFVNLCYSVIPQEHRDEGLTKIEDAQKKYYREKMGNQPGEAVSSDSFKSESSAAVMETAPAVIIQAHSVDSLQESKSINESLQVYRSLSEESEAEFSSVSASEANPIFVEEALKVPSLPFPNVSLALQTIAECRAKCLELCAESHTFRVDAKDIRQKMHEENKTAEETIQQSASRIRALQEEVDALADCLDNIESTIILYKTGPQSRDEFLKPMKHLVEDIADVYRSCIESPDQLPTFDLMLMAMKKRLTDLQMKLKPYPVHYVKKWYETVTTNRAAEGKAVILLEKQRRMDQAMVERALQGADVMPRRQLRPRSLPADHGKKVLTEIRKQPAMLDVLVEELENEMQMEDEAGEGILDESISRYFDELSAKTSLPTIEEEPLLEQQASSESVSPVEDTVTTESIPHITSTMNLLVHFSETFNTVEFSPTVTGENDIEVVYETENAPAEEETSRKPNRILADLPEDPIDIVHPKLDDIFSQLFDDTKPEEEVKKVEKMSLTSEQGKETVQSTEETKGKKYKSSKGSHNSKKSHDTSKKKNSKGEEG